MTQRADDLVAQARRRIRRVLPAQLREVRAAGGLVVDIRPEAQRRAEGELDGAVVVERNVLEWRLDPSGGQRLPQVRDHDQWIVVVCSEGYASSLAAASLADLGFENAADLEGGFQAWRAWSDRKEVRVSDRSS
jgi:rhodanese-related sulfurtransferase